MTKSFYFLGITLLLLSLNLNSQNNKNYEIATWLNFKEAAFTYTFDDNTPKQISVAVPLFDKYNYKVTVFTVSSWIKDWTELKTASKNGHEIASHTDTHPVLSILTADSLTIELKESQSKIRTEVASTECSTIAYPYCVKPNENELKKYYFAARICSGEIIPASPENFYELSSIVVGTEGSLKNAQNLNQQLNKTIEAKGWSVLLIHGVDDDGGYSAIKSTELEKHLAEVNRKNDKVWVATFAQIAKYIKERDNVRITEKNNNNKSITLALNDDLDNARYNVPITIRRKLPKGWKSAEVFVKNTKTESKIETTHTHSFIVFNAIPDNRDIKINKVE